MVLLEKISFLLGITNYDESQRTAMKKLYLAAPLSTTNGLPFEAIACGPVYGRFIQI